MPTKPWINCVRPLVTDRATKPRRSGLTMVIDKGIGIREMADLMEMASDYVDFVKLAFGSSVLYPEDQLRQKIELVRSSGVDIYPGGTLLELAAVQGLGMAFVDRLVDWGFTAMEVSEGTVDLDAKMRRELIGAGKAAGLKVFAEVGEKDAGTFYDADRIVRGVLTDIESGADWVIVEGRDSGKNVGTYDRDGNPREDFVQAVLDRLGPNAPLMWEAPMSSQHVYWTKLLGPNVNLGNVQPSDVLSLESLRQSLRGDTMKKSLDLR